MIIAVGPGAALAPRRAAGRRPAGAAAADARAGAGLQGRRTPARRAPSPRRSRRHEGLRTWVKLMVHADHDTRHGRRPLYVELVRRLRAARAGGATVLEGIWGYHGDRPPQGDKLLSLRRHVPTTTVVIDVPDRIARLVRHRRRAHRRGRRRDQRARAGVPRPRRVGRERRPAPGTISARASRSASPSPAGDDGPPVCPLTAARSSQREDKAHDRDGGPHEVRTVDLHRPDSFPALTRTSSAAVTRRVLRDPRRSRPASAAASCSRCRRPRPSASRTARR